MIEKANDMNGLSQSSRQTQFQIRNRATRPVSGNNSGLKFPRLNFIFQLDPNKGCQNQGNYQHVTSLERGHYSASNSKRYQKASSINKRHRFLKKTSSYGQLLSPKNNYVNVMNEQKSSLQNKSNNSNPLKHKILQRRGMFIIKKNRDLKAEKQSRISDVSFQKRLKATGIQEEKLQNKETYSQNVLGDGLREKSKSRPKLKTKALVCNPFEKAIKQDALNQIAKQLKTQKFEPSRIERMQESSASVGQVQLIGKLLHNLND